MSSLSGMANELHDVVESSSQSGSSNQTSQLYGKTQQVASTRSTLSNILYASASEALICTCPPGTCRQHGRCCSSCPGAQDVCDNQEKPLMSITASVNNVIPSQIRSACCNGSSHCSNPTSCPIMNNG